METEPHVVRPLPDQTLETEATEMQTDLQESNETLKTDLANLQRMVRDQTPAPAAPIVKTNPDSIPIPAPEFEPLDFENLSPQQVAEEQERRFNLKLEHQKQESDRAVRLRNTQDQEAEEIRRVEEERDQIKTFVDKTPDFEQYHAQVRSLYGQPMSVEQAYTAARIQQAGGLDQFLAQAAPAAAPEPEHRRSALRATHTQNAPDKPRSYRDAKDAGGAAWDEVVGGDAEALSALNS